MIIKRKGISLKIDRDYSYDANPRHDVTFGTMVCFHRRYSLGDETEFKNSQEFNEWYEKNKDFIVCSLPLYLLDHTGITMSTKDFKDPWDSGKVGIIFCTKLDVERSGFQNLTKDELLEKLEAEVKDYDDFLTDKKQYYYFCLRDEDDEIIDTITGFSANKFENVVKEMKDYVDDDYHFIFDEYVKKINQNCM